MVIHARVGKELVGIVDLHLGKEAVAHVGRLGLTVKKEYRGRGIGRALVEKMIAEARKNKQIKIIKLGVFAENLVAINLYQSLGFKQFGKLPNGIKHQGKYSDHDYYYLDVS